VTARSDSISAPANPSIDRALLAARTWPRANWLDLVRRDQCERWRSGNNVLAETYFELLPELRANHEDAIVLVCGEMLLRREAGDSFVLEEYQGRFAELADDLAMQFEIDQIVFGSADVDHHGDAPAGTRKLRLPGYEILREIGRGSSSVVYLARQISVDRLVAIKVVSLSVADETSLNRQRREASILSRLQHSGIVQIYDVVEAEGLMCSVIEYVDGQTLAQHSDGMPLDPKAAARLVRILAETMQVVHEAGIVHRDLKPSNVLMASGQEPKITDFGLAKLLSTDQALTTDSCLLGTPSYMPPEQASGDSSSSGVRADVYSLGAIFYELLTGRPPFLGVTILDTLSMIRDREPVAPRTLQPKTPLDLETICLKCLDKSPERRYPTASALADDLERFQNDLPITARRPSRLEKSWRWCRHNPSITALATGLLAAVVAGFLGVVWQWNQAERAREFESLARAEADVRARELQEGLERLQAAQAHVDRARVFWEWRRCDDALIAFTEAIDLRPDLASAWAERGRLYCDLGLWELAAADERRAFELNEPSQTGQWWSYAVLLAQVGDVEDYHRVCQRMQERFSGHHARFMLEMVRTVCLIPSVETEGSSVVQRIQKASLELPRDALTLYVLGLAHYRAGQFRDAIQDCTQSAQCSAIDADPYPNPLLLAMAYQQLGELDNARASMELAARSRNRWIEQLYVSGETGWGTHRGTSAHWPFSPSQWLEFDALYHEASLRLGDGETAVDPRLIVLRARAFAALGRHNDANADYEAALAVSPHDNQIRMEQHRNRAFSFLHKIDYDSAAKEFAEATKLSPRDAGLWLALAEAHLAAGNLQDYRRACAEMFERFSDTSDPRIAEKVVWGCVNQADSLPDMGHLAPLADIATASYSGASRILGAMQVRVGQYEDAIRAFRDAASYHPPNPWDWSFRAIAHHHLGQIGEARECLQQAADWIGQADRRKLPDVEVTKPCWQNLSWYEHAAALRLFDEAGALITGPRPAP
jgi:tetratricopeptide (TPR) repeat protein/predicted Ser/Thr protein kinase